MSDDNLIVETMIEFITEKEKEIQRNRLVVSESQTKNNVVKAIIKKLEECTKNED